jgi:hypothetical protein
MTFKHDWRHPVTGETGYQLFLYWIDRADGRLDIAAATLGISTRSAQRWKRQKRVPHRVAVVLDQLKNGPVIEAGLWRGNMMLRHQWRPYFLTTFKDYR